MISERDLRLGSACFFSYMNLSSFLRNVLSTIADDSQFRLVTPCFLDVYQYTTILEYYL